MLFVGLGGTLGGSGTASGTMGVLVVAGPFWERDFSATVGTTTVIGSLKLR